MAQLVAEVEGRATTITDPTIGVSLALTAAEIAGDDATAAERHYNRAIQLAQKAGNRALSSQVWVAYSRALFEWGRTAEALDTLQKTTPPA